ncbi:MAG TPA: methyltransferase domain-containing protein [Burkholderiales bacterium]|nr:methyltransferase domain-containing protein [Burkholderiales bacterium]
MQKSTNLSDWFETPLGQYLLEQEWAYFDKTVADVFGFNAVQLGLAHHDFLRMSRIPLRVSAGPDIEARVKLDFPLLPFATNSIDLLLLPHVLEFSDNPHQILREAERVLMPEGQLIICGFNPRSLWGLARRFRRSSGEYPWRGRFISLPRVKDWLALLGFEMTAGRLGCYVPPFKQEKWLRRFRLLEAAGDRWWAIAGGIYFLQAIKRVQGLRLLKPSWNEALKPKKSLAPVRRESKAKVLPFKARSPSPHMK